MLSTVITVALVLGVSTLAWALVGLLRWSRPSTADDGHAPGADAVRIVIAARNEELVLGATLDAALALVPPEQIHVISDGSTDATAAIANAAEVRLLERPVNGGKAVALAHGIRHFGLDRPGLIVLLLDADTLLAEDYLRTGLPLFADDGVAAVAGYASSARDGSGGTLLGRLLLGYRQRTYSAMQLLHKYGQAARHANAVSIVPGFASMYRGEVVAQIDIDAPGLSIEDFNMTFEVHAKRLGRIAFVPGAAHAVTQDPDTLRGYAKQVFRWGLGYWQTLRRHRPTPTLFWAAIGLASFELIVTNLLLVVLTPLAAVAGAATGLAALGIDPGGSMSAVAQLLPFGALLLGVLAADLALTVFAAIVSRRAELLLLAPFFPVVRLVDAVMGLRAMVAALRQPSDGAWRSPDRRAAAQAPMPRIAVLASAEPS